MTLIECFDSSPIENVVAALRLQPQKIVFVGSENTMSAEIQKYEEIFKRRNYSPSIYFYNLEENEHITNILHKYIEEDDKCILDLTGGDEETIFSIATFIAELDDSLRKKVSVQRFDFNYYAVDCDDDDKFFIGSRANITVSELIELHGGTVTQSDISSDESCTLENINKLWFEIKKSPLEWNNMITVLTKIEKNFDSDTIQIPTVDFYEYTERERRLFNKILKILENSNFVTLHSTNTLIKYSYKSPFFHYCIKKQGNVLELKFLLEARNHKNNSFPFFNDCQMSVTINWDNIIDGAPITQNEIDVMLMKDVTPVFVSCKNGSIDDKELYKLCDVARRFGGEHVVMLLVTSGEVQSPAFIERAKDMGIHLYRNVSKFNTQEWANMFNEILKDKTV